MSLRVNAAVMLIGYVMVAYEIEQLEWLAPIDCPEDLRCSPDWLMLLSESGWVDANLAHPVNPNFVFVRWTLVSVLLQRLRDWKASTRHETLHMAVSALGKGV